MIHAYDCYSMPTGSLYNTCTQLSSNNLIPVTGLLADDQENNSMCGCWVPKILTDPDGKSRNPVGKSTWVGVPPTKTSVSLLTFP